MGTRVDISVRVVAVLSSELGAVSVAVAIAEPATHLEQDGHGAAAGVEKFEGVLVLCHGPGCERRTHNAADDSERAEHG